MKSSLLKSLQAPAAATSASDAVEKLKSWPRNIVRAGELAVTLPDPVLQIHALGTVVKNVLAKEAQVSFRIQTCARSRPS